MNGNGQMDGITHIPGINFLDAAKKNNLQQMFSSQFQRQQQQRSFQNHHGQVSQQKMEQDRRRRPTTLVFGNEKNGKEEAEQFLLMADVNLVASGVSKNATPEQLKEFIVSKGIKVTDMELLTTHKTEARSFSYRIAIKPEDYDKALQQDARPYRVGVRIYKPKRRQQQQNSWNQQSSQTGGNIMDQTRNNRSYKDRRPGHQQMETSNVNRSYLDTHNRYEVPGFAPEVLN